MPSLSQASLKRTYHIPFFDFCYCEPEGRGNLILERLQYIFRAFSGD